MSKKIKIITLVLLVSTLLILGANLNVKAQTTATVAVLSSVGGTTTPAGGTTPSYTIGQDQTFTATPSSGWQFFYWIVTTAAGSTTYTTSSLTWNVTGAGSVQAMFLPTTNATEAPTSAGTSSIFVELSAGGSTVPKEGTTQSYAIGSTQTFAATPGSGFTFVCWVVGPATGGIVYTSSTINYNVTNSGCAIQAMFVPSSSNVTLPKIAPEFSSAAVAILAIVLVAVAVGAFALRRRPKN